MTKRHTVQIPDDIWQAILARYKIMTVSKATRILLEALADGEIIITTGGKVKENES